MFCRQATLPIDLELSKVLPEDTMYAYSQMPDLELHELHNKRSNVLEEVTKNWCPRKTKIQYDQKRASSIKLNIGQNVFKKDHTR